MADTTVIIIGAGPSGLATAASLTLSSISYIIIEREDCSVPLWRKHSYDRLHLHVPNRFCHLPAMPFPSSTPNYLPKVNFLDYLDRYAENFRIRPLYRRNVEAAQFDHPEGKWKVRARNLDKGEMEEFRSRFLVVATGETAEAYTPAVPGMEEFGGDLMHSTKFKSGKGFEGKNVLVVGAGNSGMEIALDLCLHAANTSLVVRSPVMSFFLNAAFRFISSLSTFISSVFLLVFQFLCSCVLNKFHELQSWFVTSIKLQFSEK
ncbi:hypothetical protein IC575_014414 [Cucumis melo]